MEFIQWQTAEVSESGKTARSVRGGKDTTHHGLFRLDILDLELMDKDVIFEIKNEDAKKAVEYGIRPSKIPSIRVDEDDLTIYKEKCLEVFKKILQ